MILMRSAISATAPRATHSELIDALRGDLVLNDSQARTAAGLFTTGEADPTIRSFADGLHVDTELLVLALHEEALAAEADTIGAAAIRELLRWALRRATCCHARSTQTGEPEQLTGRFAYIGEPGEVIGRKLTIPRPEGWPGQFLGDETGVAESPPNS